MPQSLSEDALKSVAAVIRSTISIIAKTPRAPTDAHGRSNDKIHSLRASAFLDRLRDDSEDDEEIPRLKPREPIDENGLVPERASERLFGSWNPVFRYGGMCTIDWPIWYYVIILLYIFMWYIDERWCSKILYKWFFFDPPPPPDGLLKSKTCRQIWRPDTRSHHAPSEVVICNSSISTPQVFGTRTTNFFYAFLRNNMLWGLLFLRWMYPLMIGSNGFESKSYIAFAPACSPQFYPHFVHNWFLLLTA